MGNDNIALKIGCLQEMYYVINVGFYQFGVYTISAHVINYLYSIGCCNSCSRQTVVAGTATYELTSSFKMTENQTCLILSDQLRFCYVLSEISTHEPTFFLHAKPNLSRQKSALV